MKFRKIKKIRQEQVYFFLGGIILIYFCIHEDCDDNSNELILTDIIRSIIIAFPVGVMMLFSQGNKEK